MQEYATTLCTSVWYLWGCITLQIKLFTRIGEIFFFFFQKLCVNYMPERAKLILQIILLSYANIKYWCFFLDIFSKTLCWSRRIPKFRFDGILCISSNIGSSAIGRVMKRIWSTYSRWMFCSDIKSHYLRVQQVVLVTITNSVDFYYLVGTKALRKIAKRFCSNMLGSPDIACWILNLFHPEWQDWINLLLSEPFFKSALNAQHYFLIMC